MREMVLFDMDREPPREIAGTIFEVAWRAGVNEQGPQGPFVTWYPDLEVSHLLSTIGASTYSDNPGLRLRRHVLLLAPRGWGKSSGASAFLKYAVGAVKLPERRKAREDRGFTPPVFIDLIGRGTSPERLMGGVSEGGRVIRPILKDANYLFASEFFSFMGNDKAGQKDMIDMMCQVLEEGQVVRSLMKFARVEMDDDTRLELEEEGVIFDPDTHSMAYEADCTFIGATRLMNERERQAIEESGLMDRLFISAWMPDSIDIEETWDKKRTVDMESMNLLRAFNDKAWRMAIERVPEPPEAYVSAVKEHARDSFKAMVTGGNLPAHQVFSGRDTTVVCQLLTAAAWERTLREADDPESPEGSFMITGDLTYTDKDVEVATYFFKKYVKERVRELMGMIKEDRKLVEDARWLSHAVVQHANEEGILEAKKVAGLSKNVVGAPSRATMYRILDRAAKRGWLKMTSDPGIFEVTADFREFITMKRNVEGRPGLN